jgi:hypothetical protein
MELVMFRKSILLFFFLLIFAAISFGQDKQIINEKYKFTLNYPNGLIPYENGTTVLEYRGTKKNYGEDSVFFLKRVIAMSTTSMGELESHMKDVMSIEAMSSNFIDSMKASFPNIKLVDKGSVYLDDRIAMHCTFSFALKNMPMKVRFILVLIKEQSSMYAFSWTSKASLYERWNKAAEDSVKSIKIKETVNNRTVF